MSKVKQFESRLCVGFKRLRESCQPIHISDPNPEKAIYFTNYVTTVQLLHNAQDKQFALRPICLAAGGACKLTPQSLAACVVRFGNSGPSGSTTALIFESSRINVTGACGFEHARMATQEYRLFLEQIPFIMRNPKTQKLEQVTLEGKMVFEGFSLSNIVSHTHLGVKPDLKKLSQMYPQAEWDPELFPGCILRVWLRKKVDCPCKKKKKNGSCECNCTCLLFDSGNIIVTGAKNLQDTICACESLRRLFHEQQQLCDDRPTLPSHLRYQARIDYQMQDTINTTLEVEFVGVLDRSKVNQENVDYENILDTLLDDTPTHVLASPATTAKRQKTQPDHSPFVQACINGQLDMVQFMININGDSIAQQHAATVLDLTKDSVDPVICSIRRLLSKYV